MKVDWRVICVGIICLTAAEIVALLNNINGTYFTIYAAIIGGAIGVFINPKS